MDADKIIDIFVDVVTSDQPYTGLGDLRRMTLRDLGRADSDTTLLEDLKQQAIEVVGEIDKALPQAPPNVAVALASIAVHAKEALGPNGHPVDLTAIEGALSIPGVSEYLEKLDAMALLPVPRSTR